MTSGQWPDPDDGAVVLRPADGTPVIEMDREPDERPFRPRWRRLALVAALLLAAGGGYALGRYDARPAPAAAPTPSPGVTRLATVVVAGDICSVVTGPVMQLGADITNASDAPMTVTSVAVGLPMGGLKLLSQAWGTCGQNPPLVGDSQPVDPGGTLWFTATFELTELCPTPYPVTFVVTSTVHDQQVKIPVNEFPDLGMVRFEWCHG